MSESKFETIAPFEQKKEIAQKELFSFNERGQEGHWLRLEADGHQVEGALYDPEKPNGEMIVFVPGSPGDSVDWFENKDMPALLEDGYKIFVIRHGGIKINENTKSAVNNEKRSEVSGYIGNEQMEINDWIKEPEIALEYFSGEKITVISHSLGSLMVGSSIIELGKHNKLNQVKKWISLSGVTYSHQTFKEQTKGIWKDFSNGYLKECCQYEDGDKVVRDIEAAIIRLNEELPKTKLPENFRVISVNPKQDEYVPIGSRDNLHEKIGTGLSVIDNTLTEEFLFNTKTKNQWAMVHDFLNLNHETLRRLVKMTVSKYRHDATFKNPEAKQPRR